MTTPIRNENSFLAALSAREHELLRTHLVPFELRAGDCLHRFGCRIEDVIFPASGLVAMTMPLREGASVGVALVGREAIIGGFAAAASSPATCNAEVHIAGEAWQMSASAFRSILDQNPAIRRRAARYDIVLLAQAQQTALCHAAHPVEARVCRWLLEVQERTGSNKIPLTQNALAQMLGVRRTTVTLVVGRLKAAGALRCHRGCVEIVSQEELRRLSCDCNVHLKSYVATLSAPRGDGHDKPAALDRAGLHTG